MSFAELAMNHEDSWMFTWDDEHKIGNELIDLQHEQFFNLANGFQKAVQDREPLSLQVMIAKEILEYSRFHLDRKSVV